MDTDRLRLFIEIVETGTLSAAASRVHITQPAASRNLKVLEEELGAPLFERRGRGLVLTPVGRALVPMARALLEDLDAIREQVEEVTRRDFFDVRIGTVDSVATYLMPAIIAPMTASFPELAIKFHTARTVELLRRLDEDELDIALVAWSGSPDHATSARVGPYDLQFYGDRTKFSDLEHVSTEAALARFPIVQIESRPGQPTLIDPNAPSFAVAGSLATVKSLILGGFGVGALLGFMLSPAESEALVRARIPHDPHCALWALFGSSWTAQPRASEINDVLLGALRAEFASRGLESR